MRKLVYTMFFTDDHASFHLWWGENLVEHKSENIVTMILFSSYQTPSLRYSLQVDYFLDLTHDSRKSEVLFVKIRTRVLDFQLDECIELKRAKTSF